jgi:hypothetical protein
MLELLMQAAQCEYGLIVSSDDPLALRAALYRERAKDPTLQCLSLILSPDHPTTDLWIVRETT